jgi:hypothetical protein
VKFDAGAGDGAGAEFTDEPLKTPSVSPPEYMAGGGEKPAFEGAGLEKLGAMFSAATA